MLVMHFGFLMLIMSQALKQHFNIVSTQSLTKYLDFFLTNLPPQSAFSVTAW